MLLMPGDRRIPQFAAAGGVLGVVFAIPAFFVVGIGAGTLLVAFSVASFLAAGLHSVRLEPSHDDVPEPVPDEHQVLVRVRAAGLNRTDLRRTQQHFKQDAGPHIAGLELARMLVRRADHILTPAAAELARLVRREMKALAKAGTFGGKST